MTETQRRAANFAWKTKWCILALDMGLGKSRVSLEVSRLSGGNTLVICPAYLVENWNHETHKWTPENASHCHFISYERCQKMSREWWSQFENIILDEAHYLKSMTAKRTQFIHTMIADLRPERVMMLTGTPIKNRVPEIYSLIALTEYRADTSEFLDKFPENITFSDYFSFRREFDIQVRNRSVRITKWEGIRNEEELKFWLAPRMIRIKADFEQPFVNDVHLGENLPGLYEAFLKWAEANEGIAPDIKADAALKTAPWTVKHCKELEEQSLGPIVVFTDHVKSAETIGREMEYPVITGSIPTDRRAKLAEDFQAGRLKGIVATIGSFSTGVNLTAANQMVFNDLPWVPGDYDQAVARIVRLGQARKCHIHRMILSPQVEYILAQLGKKREVINTVIHETSTDRQNSSPTSRTAKKESASGHDQGSNAKGHRRI